MGWSQLTLVTDAELGNIEPEATSSDRPWGAASWPKPRAEAKRTLKIWLERDFANQSNGIALPGVADRILDRWNPDRVFRFTSSAWTDLTTSARDDNEEDVDLAAALATFATDRIYVGALWEFEGLALKLLSHLNAIASVLTVKYWSGTGWSTLSGVDGTTVSGKTCAQSGRVTWTLPTDWETRRLNGTGEEYFWVEISVSAALTAGTVATQILPIHAPDGLKRVAAYLALAHIFMGLSAQAAAPEAWLARVTNDKRTGYRDQAEDLYGQLRDGGGLPIDLNLTGAVDVEERTATAQLRVRRG